MRSRAWAPSLRTVQRWLAGQIVPDGTLVGALQLRTPAPRLADRPGLGAPDRLAIYTRAYLARLGEVLGNDYPAVRERLGAIDFPALVKAYVAAHPSGHPNLNQLGARFPAFLARSRRPSVTGFVRDLARLELARSRALDAPGAPVLQPADLATATPAQLRLQLQPSAQLLEFGYPVGEWFAETRAGARRRSPRPRRTWICVFRAGYRLRQLSLTREQHRLLCRLAAGRSLATALVGTAPGQAIAGWFREWAAWGLFATAAPADE